MSILATIMEQKRRFMLFLDKMNLFSVYRQPEEVGWPNPHRTNFLWAEFGVRSALRK